MEFHLLEEDREGAEMFPDETLREHLEYLEVDERRECEQSYYEFVRVAWDILEPQTTFKDNWHIRYICSLLQKEIERIAAKQKKDRDIIINVPPRSAKSYICTVFLAPWAWTRFPHLRFINVSYEEGLAIDLCMKSRRLVESEWYQHQWGSVFKLTSDQNTKKYFDNDAGGFRRGCPTNSITGFGCDVLIYDDPQNPKKAESDIERENTKTAYGQTGYSRLNDQEVGIRIVIQQRLHGSDLTGHLMSGDPDKYFHVCIPAEATDDIRPKELAAFYKDGLFWPERFPWHQLADAKLPTNLGTYGYAGQYLQSPSPPEGGTFQRVWWRFWIPADRKDLLPPSFKDAKGVLHTAKQIVLPDRFESGVDTWDTAVEGGTNNDFYAGLKMDKIGAQKFILDAIHEQMAYPDAKRRVRDLWTRQPPSSTLLIEKSSNGPAIKADLEAEVPGIITVPTGRLSKEDRVRIYDTVPYAAQVEAGNVYLPHPTVAKWVSGFIEEHAKFPKGTHDDYVDAAAQGCNYLTQVKPVWPYYQPMDPVHHRPIKINWEPGGYLHYGGIFLDESLNLHLLAGYWDKRLSKLSVYGTLLANQMQIRNLAAAAIDGMHLKFRKLDALVCNHTMFGPDSSKSTARVLEEEIYRIFKVLGSKRSVFITEPRDYNRLGAITLTNILFSRNQIVVGDKCKEASRQFSAWYIDKDEPAAGFGYCEALAQIVSEINRYAKLREVPKPIDSYRPVLEEKKKSMNDSLSYQAR
jgi:predicted phage terminase large subunit-like protein